MYFPVYLSIIIHHVPLLSLLNQLLHYSTFSFLSNKENPQSLLESLPARGEPRLVTLAQEINQSRLLIANHRRDPAL